MGGSTKLMSSGAGGVILTTPGSIAADVTVNLPTTNCTLIGGTNGIAPEASGGTGTTTGYYGFKNRIINGDMRIDQRNAGASVTIPASSTTYLVDRWNAYATQASKFTVQQTPSATETGYATRVGAGFTNYLACTSSASTSVGSSDYYVVNQRVEGLNISDLAWGTANAKTVTLSAWVYSSLTGTFGGAIQNSAQDRSYPFSFTISSANTWTQISVTITGDTSGTWLTTNGIGMRVFFNLGSGSTYSGTAGSWGATTLFSATGATSVVGTNGATFYITGVQLEKGSTATSFDYRPYGTELALCQRYYQRTTPGSAGLFQGAGVAYSTTNVRFVMPFLVQMRTAPSALEQSGTASDYAILNTSSWTVCSAVPVLSVASVTSISLTLTVSSGLSTNGGAIVHSETGTGYLGWSAEL